MLDEKIYNMVLDSLLENNKKIKKDSSFDEYLASYKNSELLKLAVLLPASKDAFIEVFKLRQSKKANLISYIRDNIKDILEVVVKLLDIDNNSQLQKLVNHGGYISYSVNMPLFSLKFILFLKNFCLVNVYYDKKNSMIEINMPKEFIDSLNILYKDKNLKGEIQSRCKIYDFMDMILDTYGILTLEEAHSLVKKHLFKIDIKELANILFLHSLMDEGFNYFKTEEITLIGNVEFSDLDFTLEFFESCGGKLNTNFSLIEYQSIYDQKYFHKFDLYKKLIKLLVDNYDLDKEDIEYFDASILMDYIYSAQTDVEQADSNFNKNIDLSFEDMDPITKNIILKYIKEIFANFPKWNKRGNI